MVHVEHGSPFQSWWLGAAHVTEGKADFAIDGDQPMARRTELLCKHVCLTKLKFYCHENCIVPSFTLV